MYAYAYVYIYTHYREYIIIYICENKYRNMYNIV